MTKTGPCESDSKIPTDTVFRLLSDQHRRTVLRELGDCGEQVTTEELAARVASRVYDAPRDAVSNDQRQRILARLHHNHLPRLADAGVIDYDRRSGSVAATARTAQFEDFLELASR